MKKDKMAESEPTSAENIVMPVPVPVPGNGQGPSTDTKTQVKPESKNCK